MRRPPTIFGIVGALSAFPRRLAARAVAEKGGQLRRGIARRTSRVVLGRTLLEKWSEAEIEQRVDLLRDSGAELLSENGFLRWLGLLEPPERADLARQSLLDQSGLDAASFDMLVLFDAFEHDCQPFSFRDLILCRKYTGLLAAGATWSAIARSVHRSGSVASITALTLRPEGARRIYALDGAQRSELDGQQLLPLETAEDEAEEYFALAEAAEDAQLFAEAAALYNHCLTIDPGDSVAAFNRANCLKAAGDHSGAGHAYALAIRSDPGFVEAWFNYAGLLAEDGKRDAARQHLLQAIAVDPDYADAIYNLGKLEYEAGDLVAARRWWTRYLELDQTSDWAKIAARGVAYANLALNRSAG